MYTVIRKIHLFTALILLVFVLMYFVTGYAIIHREWLPADKPDRTTEQQTLAGAAGKSPEQLSVYLQDQFDLRGKRQVPQVRKDGSIRLGYDHPGETCEAIVAPSGDQVTITRSQLHLAGTSNGFHRLHGYGGGWLYDCWALAYDLASFSMILFALSGIYLWYKSTISHWLGYLLLSVSFAYTIGMVLYLAWGR